jgi:hypothetical protein
VVFATPALLLAVDFGVWVFVGISSGTLRDEDREWLARSSAWTELFCACWVGIGALVLLLPGWVFEWRAWGDWLLGAAGGASGWLSSRGGGEGKPSSAEGKPPSGLKDQVSALAMKAAPAVFLVSLIVGLVIVTNIVLASTGALFPNITAAGSSDVSWTQHEDLLERTYWEAAWIGMVLLGAFSWIMARFININTFSLHDMYRNRLIRAYLGASNPKREASRFTGFAHTDNVMMRDLPPEQRPFHVVNVALNVVAGERLAWQQRKAQSFTISPLHSGNFQLGYRSSGEFGGIRGISLGTALTISGAAASPNMGYHSSGVVGFIMTLFNARLGAWLGNPGAAGARTWRQAGPRSAVQSLVKEAFGLTTNTSPYVYLSDGGHFENLGLYEMVLRRCRSIVVLDSGCDPELHYEDLGNALRKIRIDLGVPIDFSDDAVRPLREKKKRCAAATIRYSAVDATLQDGVLIYVKPMMLGNEPPDVASYAASQCAFPHESTADQWFNESQTESYRILGLCTMDEICEGWSGQSLEDFARHVAGVYLGYPRARTETAG